MSGSSSIPRGKSRPGPACGILWLHDHPTAVEAGGRYSSGLANPRLLGAGADDALGSALNAVGPDLSAFKARGGKLISCHGWARGGAAGRRRSRG